MKTNILKTAPPPSTRKLLIIHESYWWLHRRKFFLEKNKLEILTILALIVQKMQQHTVYLYLSTALHVSGGISYNHQELISLCLQYLALRRPVVIVNGSSNGTASGTDHMICTRGCNYSFMYS